MKFYAIARQILSYLYERPCVIEAFSKRCIRNEQTVREIINSKWIEGQEGMRVRGGVPTDDHNKGRRGGTKGVCARAQLRLDGVSSRL